MLDPILVVDTDQKFLQELERVSQLAPLKAVVASSCSEAKIWMEGKAWPFSGVFFDSEISEVHGTDLVKWAHELRMGVPLYLMLKPGVPLPFQPEQMEGLGLSGVLNHPLEYRDLVRSVAPLIDELHDPYAAPLGRIEKSIDEVVDLPIGEFVPLRAKNFLSGSRSLFDVYVRVGNEKFLKLLRAGEAFEIERVTGYLRKGVERFYLRKSDQSRYMNYCDRLTQAMLQTQRIPIEVAQNQVCHLGDLTYQLLIDRGLNVSEVSFAFQFARSLGQVVERSEWGQQEVFREFITNLHHYEHGVSTAMIALLMLKDLHPESGRLQYSVGLAAFLHDIGLGAEWPTHLDENPDRMSSNQKMIYLSHPERGAEILAQVPGIEKGILQAVEQHHERRDGKGFPFGLEQGQIHRYGELIGLAERFSNWISEAAKNPRIQPFEEMELRELPKFSVLLANSFRSVFLRG